MIVPGQVRARRAGLLAGLAASRAAAGCCGGVFPGWSSPDGGIEEFPLLREISRSSRASFASSSVIFASLSSSSARRLSFAARSDATSRTAQQDPRAHRTYRTHGDHIRAGPPEQHDTPPASKPAPITPCQPANQPTPSASRGDLNVYHERCPLNWDDGSY